MRLAASISSSTTELPSHLHQPMPTPSKREASESRPKPGKRGLAVLFLASRRPKGSKASEDAVFMFVGGRGNFRGKRLGIHASHTRFALLLGPPRRSWQCRRRCKEDARCCCGLCCSCLGGSSLPPGTLAAQNGGLLQGGQRGGARSRHPGTITALLCSHCAPAWAEIRSGARQSMEEAGTWVGQGGREGDGAAGHESIMLISMKFRSC